MEDNIKKTVSYIGWTLLLSVISFYIYGVYLAIHQTLRAPIEAIDYPSFLSTTIASVQALLLTNLGFLLGISVTNPTSKVAAALGLSKNIPGVEMAPPAPLDIKSQVQLFALIIYLLSLIACMITWITKEFKSDTLLVVPLITESSKMFIGVALAYLSAVLK